MFTVRMFAIVVVFGLTTIGSAQTPAAIIDVKNWVARHPGLDHHVGLAEMMRAHGRSDLAAAEWDAIATNPKNIDEHTIACFETVCWRRLAAKGSRDEAFRNDLERLKALAPNNLWASVFDMIVAVDRNDRASLVKSATAPNWNPPAEFPLAFAEKRHFTLAKATGSSRIQAGVDVIAARSYESLYKLRDLDRALTREAEFCVGMDQNATAGRLLATRDRLRIAYDAAAQHLVEKLFVLNLTKKTKERDALLEKAKRLPYLHEREKLAALLERMEEPRVWNDLIERLLRSELAVISTPPDVGIPDGRVMTDLRVQAKSKKVQGNIIEYRDGVMASFQSLSLKCDHLQVLHHDDGSPATLSAIGDVLVHGIRAYPAGVRAQRLVYTPESETFTLGGTVRLQTHGSTTKLESCSLSVLGDLRDARSLFDDFRNALSIDAKRGLLPRITRIYDDSELTDEVRFLLALDLLRPHLTWHAPYLPALPIHGRHASEEKVKVLDVHGFSPWQEAMTGEDWMYPDIPENVTEQYRSGLRSWYAKFTLNPQMKGIVPPDLPIPEPALAHWRLRNPRHADVVRAALLLSGVNEAKLSQKAQHWREELRRNNTVITFDIAGGAPAGADHSLLMDVRNTERVKFKLYRVDRPTELVHAASEIGTSFIYQDHHLDLNKEISILRDEMLKVHKNYARFKSRHGEFKMVAAPQWTGGQLISQWEADVAELPHHDNDSSRRHRHHRWWDEDRWHDEPDAHYFDDECHEYEDRMQKSYRPSRFGLSSWQCDRIVKIPGKHLAKAGAYVLMAEANGQIANVPIVVEPLSLTLRRCRDGVFVLAADAKNATPLVGAEIHANGLQAKAVTDKQGVAFAKVLGFGDRALIAHHQGRYAIGGFGAVFEGIYDAAPSDEPRMLKERMARSDRGLGKDIGGHIYSDRHVVIGYTDRPTYRPGQNVQFKLIVRKLEPPGQSTPQSESFRAQDFDAATKLSLPDLDQSLRFGALDPKGREVGSGHLKLSEFGTAAGKLTLNTECVLGAYTLRVTIAGEPRLVPDLFAVKEYRRPNFEVTIVGVPKKIAKSEALDLHIGGRYYFGSPVKAGEARVSLMRKNSQHAIIEKTAKLGDDGQAKLRLQMPRSLQPGNYVVVCAIVDESGRTVMHAIPTSVDDPAGLATTPLSDLPGFHPLAQPLIVTTRAKEIRVSQDLTDLRFLAKDGRASVKFPGAGWYTIQAGADETSIYIYAGNGDPRLHQAKWHERDRLDEIDNDDGLATSHKPKWVNLSDFSHETDRRLSKWERPTQHVIALFDRHTAAVNGKLRLLVYLPRPGAKVLFTFEGRTILDYHVWQSDAKAGRYQVVDLPIKERFYPNVYVQGRVLPGGVPAIRTLENLRERMKMQEQARKLLESDGDDAIDSRWCRVDVTNPTNALADPELRVTIDTDRTAYRPGDAVRARVAVTDAAGKPASAEVSLAAVDESVFAFGEDNLDALASIFSAPSEPRRFLPKPWRVSLGNRWSRAVLIEKRDLVELLKADLMQMAMQQQSAMKALEKTSSSLESGERRVPNFTLPPLPRLGGELPAGQIPLARLREHFQETATWMPQLHTNVDGIAQAVFTLPDSLTRYRLSAVALTKETRIGVGRSHITAGLPLAVQVFVPRFAVEKDRIEAVALIHNHTRVVSECSYAWEIAGTLAEFPKRLEGKIQVPANGSVKVVLPIVFDAVGSAKIMFRANTSQDADAEARTLPIHPIGKPMEVNANDPIAAAPQPKPGVKQVAGSFIREGRIALPAGFVADEIQISLASSNIAQALHGLDYLVDYPYGCIEQTMSRFLPVIMIKHAMHESGVQLQPDIEAKLPDILAKGLERVYSHQNASGSWGWFGGDSPNLSMTTYVVYGLGRCQAAGTRVDPHVLKKGCDFLHAELRKNTQDYELAARAWYSLAAAGHADRKELEAFGQKILTRSDMTDTASRTALACRLAGLPALSELLWKQAKAMSPWDTESTALLLKTQIAFGASYANCEQTAKMLLARRQGSRWHHTRDTSWALESLANMMAYLPAKGTLRGFRITSDGKTILDLGKADAKRSLFQRIRLTADQMPAREGLDLRLHADSDEPIFVAVRAVGVQREIDPKATGTRVRLSRQLEALDGKPITGPLTIGQVIRVRLRLDLQGAEEYLLVEERRPSLCEFADDRITGLAAQSAVHQEFRDDRLCVFFRNLPPGAHEIVYYLRAETIGQATHLRGIAFPMYNEKNRGETGGGKLEVTGTR